MRVQTIKIAAGESFDLAANGDYVRVRSSAVDLNIEQPDSGEIIEVSQGDDFQFTPFSRLRISHADGAEQTVKLIISKGKKAGSSQVSGSITGSVTVSSGTVAISNVNGAFTQGRASVTNTNQTIIAANSSRRYCLVQNNSVSAVLRLRVDGVAATTSQGFRLQPGATLELPAFCTTGAINAIMETADATAGNVEFVTG